MQKGLSIKYEVDTTPVDAHIKNTKHCNNTVRPLCLLALSGICLVFLRVSKKQGMFLPTEPIISVHMGVSKHL